MPLQNSTNMWQLGRFPALLYLIAVGSTLLFVCLFVFTAQPFTLKVFQQLKGHNLSLLIGPHVEHMTLNLAFVPKCKV